MDYFYMVTGNVLILSLTCELDHHLAAELRVVLDGVIEERGISAIVFDFEKVKFMDSSGIGLIMGRFRTLGRNGRIAISGAGVEVKRIVEISGLMKIVSLADNVNEAVHLLQN